MCVCFPTSLSPRTTAYTDQCIWKTHQSLSRPHVSIFFASVVIINDGATDVQLTVNREKGQQYDVEVTYETEQMSDSVTISGSIVYPALENQDFRRQSGTLTFSSGSQVSNFSWHFMYRESN